MLEAQKLKRLWPLSVFAPFDGCETPKEQQPSFLLGQFQIELRKSFPQLVLEVLRVSAELEASHNGTGRSSLGRTQYAQSPIAKM